MVGLNTGFAIKSLKLKNRIVMAPMCQYAVTAQDGRPNDWHFVHYVSRAVGGTGLLLVEATAVDPQGRISDKDLGIWDDSFISDYKKIVDAVHAQGAKIGIQISHAGRKAEDAPQPVGPSNLSVQDSEGTASQSDPKPQALTEAEIQIVVEQFGAAARRAVAAGFDTIELHAAHGYLLHQFHSPGINTRTDAYGRDLTLFGTQVIRAMVHEMPEDMPLLLRISAIEYMDGGYDLAHSLAVAKRYIEAGIDCIHVSSGGEAAPGVKKPGNYLGYQLPFARAYAQAFDVPVIAVGILEDFRLAQQVVANEDADLIAIGRGMLNDPYWAMHAINTTTGTVDPPQSYARGIRPIGGH
ncbi:MAG: NADPH dehydrogenase [Lachnospiraceae bacterium]